MELDEAYRIVRSYMDQSIDNVPSPRLMISRAELRENGWLFFYSSIEFVKTRSFWHALGGDSGLLVKADGNVVTVGNDLEGVGDAFHPGAV